MVCHSALTNIKVYYNYLFSSMCKADSKVCRNESLSCTLVERYESNYLHLLVLLLHERHVGAKDSECLWIHMSSSVNDNQLFIIFLIFIKRNFSEEWDRNSILNIVSCLNTSIKEEFHKEPDSWQCNSQEET